MVINIIFFWILVVFGVIISLYNWIIVFNCVIKSKNSSCIPLLGGGAIVLAMNLPGIDMEEYESIPLLLDYGCIPLFVHTFFSFIYKMLKGLFKQSKKHQPKGSFLTVFHQGYLHIAECGLTEEMPDSCAVTSGTPRNLRPRASCP